MSLRRAHLTFYFAVVLIGVSFALAQTAPPLTLTGTVKSGNTPLPGVTLTATEASSGKKIVTSTDVDGTYSVSVPAGKYTVRADLTAFAPLAKELTVVEQGARADFQLVLRSRVPRPAPQQRATGGGPAMDAIIAARAAQPLSVMQEQNDFSGGAVAPQGAPEMANSPDAANESTLLPGAMGQTQDLGRNFDEMRERLQEMRQRGELPGGPGGPGGMGGGGPLGGRGGPGGFGGGPGGPGGLFGGRGGRFNINRVHGSVFYSAGTSALNAEPYSLSGAPTEQPDYGSNRFGVALGGPLKVPKVMAPANTFFFFSLFGTRASTPYDVFSHVPTELERQGDFSQTVNRNGQPVQIFQGGALNNIVTVNPVAQKLLRFIPLPNQPGDQNFRFSSSAENDGTNLSFRLMHSFGVQSGRGRGMRGRNGINFGLNYSSNTADQLRPFPTVGGKTTTTGWNATAGYTFSRAKWTNNLRVNFNRAKVATQNLFAGVSDVAALAGISGASTNPLDWGVPNLSFSNYQGLSDVAPLARRDDTLQLSDTFVWSRGKHNFRFGGDFRHLWTTLRNNTNPRGTFVFTGFATAAQDASGRPIAGTGYDFADFLLGFAQQTSIQYSRNQFSFTANSWDLFISDDWRVTGNLTLELGLRYEYIAPYTESHGQIVNLDAAPGFIAVAPVLPGAAGPYTGVFPASLVNPDRNNFAPRVGIAWKPFAKTVVRAGYGVNYNNSQYRNIVQNLALQPPFSFTQTNIGTTAQPLTLAAGFPASGSTVTNNYGVDRNYRLGYVQMWNLNVQRELGWSTVLNVGYSGSKGTALDMVRAPNRGPEGLRITDVQPFLWETSEGSSILHSASVRVRKRLQNGIAIGGTYTFAKSIDNASSIGGGAVVVAQNDLDLRAERGLSSFDQRHRFTGDYVIELPFGERRRWFTDPNTALARIFGNWQWSGSFTVASGMPFTARVLGNFVDVARGTNGTLRASTTGLPVALANPSIGEWFNTAAFTVPPPGQFGDAGRNTIIGPGTALLNMAMAKSFPMRDNMNLELRTEVTNVFNHPQFTAIDTVVNSPTFGHVVSVGAARRLQFAARFRF